MSERSIMRRLEEIVRRFNIMLYPYMTYADNTEITHSGKEADGTVKVYIETPVFQGFKHATCILPSYVWIEKEGYTDEEMNFWDEYLHHNAHLILELAAEGGYAHATAV